MEERIINNAQIEEFAVYLVREERVQPLARSICGM